MFRILYRLVAALARLAVRSARSKDLVIIVLRHQRAVLRRQVDGPDLNDDDRCLLGAIAAALPRILRDDERRTLLDELLDNATVYPDRLTVAINGVPPFNVGFSEVGLKTRGSIVSEGRS